MPNRQAALDWEQRMVNDYYKSTNNLYPNQLKPLPSDYNKKKLYELK